MRPAPDAQPDAQPDWEEARVFKPARLFPPGSPASFLVGAPRPRGLRRLPLSSPSPACSEEVMHRVRSVGVSAQTHNDVVQARQDLRSQL